MSSAISTNLMAATPLCRVVLVEPLIPENTGNIARTCVGTGSELHLVGPLGFEMSEKRVKRAGLDYWEHLRWHEHADFATWHSSVAKISGAGGFERVFYIETHARRSLYDADFKPGDWLVFGKETSGLERSLIESNDAHAFYIPMPGQTRSLNLSNAVAITVFELLRQTS